MKHRIAILLLGLTVATDVRGQNPFQPIAPPFPNAPPRIGGVPELSPSAPSDPFDLSERRPRTPAQADRQLLARHSIEPTADALLEFFRKRTLPDDDRKAALTLIKQLGSPEFRVREKASTELIKFGPPILEMLRQAEGDDDLEIARRAQECADRIHGTEPRAEVATAAVRTLTRLGAADAVPVLLGYLPYTEYESVADEVRESLRTLSDKAGKARPELTAALRSPLAERRAAAGMALAANKEHGEAVKKLLKDDDVLVRLRVAQALVEHHDKSAVPTLIETLPLASARHAWTGEELLMRIGEGRNPPLLPRTGDEAARKKFVAGWSAWWAKNEKDIDLAKLKTPELLGHTVVVLLDLGRVQELNAKNDVIWQIDGLVFPLDVQALPNGNVLVAEYHAGRVTERDRARGEIRWQKEITGPLMAQRLPNHHTFIASDAAFVEVDEKGNEVYSVSLPAGERAMKAVKLANGEIVALTSESRIVRMDTKGKELGSFDIDLGMKLFGGRIDVLPNGRVLVPHNREGKVVEYDQQGKAVWEVSVPDPVAATRLPNGNTIVTTMQPQTGAIEYDREGNPAGWSYRTGSRVTRAIRR